MDPRTTIPALALLGLSCTDCTDHADIDGDAFPIVEDEDERRGWALEITAEHRDDLAYDNEQVDDGLVGRYDDDSELTLPIADAAKHRSTVEGDLGDAFGFDEYADSGLVTVAAGDGSYDDTSDTSAGDSSYTTDALDPDERSFDEVELERGNPVHPQLAGARILDCELAAELLTCKRTPGSGDSDELLT